MCPPARRKCSRRIARCGPIPEALALTQDRLVEKQFVRSLGVATADFVDGRQTPARSARAVARLGRNSILKTRRLGYDGKGQTQLRDGGDLAVAFRTLGGAPCILESVVPFTKEVSVVAARGLNGEFRAYDVCENVHEHHILATDAGACRDRRSNRARGDRHRPAHRGSGRIMSA